MGPFAVADLNAKGELLLKEFYRYQDLERIPGATDLIASFSADLWRSPREFEAVPSGSRIRFRWRATADTAGIATMRCPQGLASVSLLVSGLVPEADAITLAAFQRHLLSELHDTGYEPAFELMEIPERPLVATIGFNDPATEVDRMVLALADRCFAAAFFRYHGLA